MKQLSLEIIKQVTDLEQTCAQRKVDAQAAAKRTVAEAEKAGQAMLEQRRAQAEAQVKTMMADAEAKAAAQAKAVQEETERSCTDLKDGARKQLEAAAEVIVRRVVTGK